MKTKPKLTSLSIILAAFLLGCLPFDYPLNPTLDCSQTAGKSFPSLGGQVVDVAALDADWELHVISATSGGPDGVRLADMNFDGLCDVITAFETGGEVRVFKHPGLAEADQPWPSDLVGSVARGEDAFGVDLDSDGAVDVVSSHEGDTLGIFVHWSLGANGGAWLTQEMTAAMGHAWLWAFAMDVNEDGHVDLVAGSKDDYFNERNSVGELAWLENPGSNPRDLRSWQYHPIDYAGWTMSIIPLDVDGDGNLDLLVTDRNADKEHMGARWLRNPGAGWEQPWESQFLADLAGTSPTFMAVGDLDNDGSQELVIPLVDRDRIMIMTQTPLLGNGTYSAHQVRFRTEAELGELKAVAVSDVDLDGRADIIVSFVGGEVGLAWLSYKLDPFNGAWTFHPVATISNGKFDLVQLYDVDGDGDKDILTTEELLGLGVLWFENPALAPGE